MQTAELKASFEAILENKHAQAFEYWHDTDVVPIGHALDAMQQAYDKGLSAGNDCDVTENTLVIDNISEALYECIEEGSERFRMLICEINGNDGVKYQAQVLVTCREKDWIDNTEEMPVLNHDSQYRIVKF